MSYLLVVRLVSGALAKKSVGKPKAIKCMVIDAQLGVFGDRPIDLPSRGSKLNNQKNQ
jgi:hypothetical protein